MNYSTLDLSRRDRQILCGLFLSKFDQEALQYLGFEGFTEAFNTLGYSLQAKPASIKNYRDELDPYFPNSRMGWHKRPLREHCQHILEKFTDIDLVELGEIIKGFILPPTLAESMPEVKTVLSTYNPEPSHSFARRLITGRAAEQYFLAHYPKMTEFASAPLIDTTSWGCGFDFKVTPTKPRAFLAVEIKGLRGRYGQIQMTALEFEVAEALQERYFLIIVRNFLETPFHSVINNPTKSSIQFTQVKRKEIRLSWNANIAE
jgi:hypothetical protein